MGQMGQSKPNILKLFFVQFFKKLGFCLPHCPILFYFYFLFFAFNQFYILYPISILNFKKFIYILWLYMLIMTK
jgi:hypothetical protein